MEFSFRAGNRGPRGPSSSASGGPPPAPLPNPRHDYFGGPAGPLPPPSLEWEAARREEIIRKEVNRRLIEEEVRREFEAKGDLAFAQAHHGGFGPGPFFPPGHFMPPPVPLPMHPPPHAPPPMPFEEFGAWHGFNQFGPRPHAGFGERMPFICEEKRWSPPRPMRKQKLQLLEIEPSGGPEALSSKSKVPRVKRKADSIVEPTVRKNVQKVAKDWSCALCQVTATCEAGLNEHLEGRRHKAKLAQCGASKVISDDKNNSRKVSGNKSVTDPCNAPKKICILVDGVMHEVVQKNNYLWCDRCKVRCDSNLTMAGHLRSKKHSKLNKVWTSIEAVRTNIKTNEDLISPSESKVNTNDSTDIPGVIKGDRDTAIKVDECSPTENPLEIMKESTSMASEVESTDTGTEVHENSPVETPVKSNKESMDQTNDVGQLVPKEE
uniref:Uncharacterized protein n=1 Tax=Avena sativa TaxID=4498 RepID=A0ACD5Z8A4_AVESA